jgi:hypothetical protein
VTGAEILIKVVMSLLFAWAVIATALLGHRRDQRDRALRNLKFVEQYYDQEQRYAFKLAKELHDIRVNYYLVRRPPKEKEE